MSYSEAVTVSKSSVPILAVVILAVIFGFGLFGREIGIDATPSFLIFNDEKIIKIRGNQPIDVFRNVIEELSSTSA